MHTKVTNEGLYYVGKMESLKSLLIDYSEITAKGFRILSNLKNLQKLYINLRNSNCDHDQLSVL